MSFAKKISLAAAFALFGVVALAGIALAASEEETSWFLLYGSFFLGGLALNLTPCVYPLIPITVGFFAGRGKTKRGALLQSLVYLAGLVAMYTALGSLAALSGSLFGEALAHPLVLIAIAAFILLMAASQFGLWEIRLPSRLTSAAATERAGLFGAFFMGLTAGVLAVSCLAPVVSGLLVQVARIGDVWFGIKVFAVLSLGLGTPLAVLAFFSDAAGKLPKAGDWMVWVKKLFGWMLVGAALYVLLPLVGEDAFRWGLFAVGIAGAVHLSFFEKSGEKRFSKGKLIVAGLLTAVSLTWLVVTWPAPAATAGAGIPWQPISAKALEAAKKAGKPVALDFTAEWCAYCRKMDATTYKDPKVVSQMENFVPLKIDVTNQTPEKRRFMASLGVRGLPTVVFISPKGNPMPQLNLSGYRDASTMVMWLKLVLAQTKDIKAKPTTKPAAKPKS